MTEVPATIPSLVIPEKVHNFIYNIIPFGKVVAIDSYLKLSSYIQKDILLTENSDYLPTEGYPSGSSTDRIISFWKINLQSVCVQGRGFEISILVECKENVRPFSFVYLSKSLYKKSVPVGS